MWNTHGALPSVNEFNGHCNRYYRGLHCHSENVISDRSIKYGGGLGSASNLGLNSDSNILLIKLFNLALPPF